MLREINLFFLKFPMCNTFVNEWIFQKGKIRYNIIFSHM